MTLDSFFESERSPYPSVVGGDDSTKLSPPCSRATGLGLGLGLGLGVVFSKKNA